MKKVVIYCIQMDENGIIRYLETVQDEKDSKTLLWEKETLIKWLNHQKSININVNLITLNKTRVELIKNKYFRTDGDQNAENDLLDLDPCNGIPKMTDEIKRNLLNDTK